MKPTPNLIELETRRRAADRIPIIKSDPLTRKIERRLRALNVQWTEPPTPKLGE